MGGPGFYAIGQEFWENMCTLLLSINDALERHAGEQAGGKAHPEGGAGLLFRQGASLPDGLLPDELQQDELLPDEPFARAVGVLLGMRGEGLCGRGAGGKVEKTLGLLHENDALHPEGMARLLAAGAGGPGLKALEACLAPAGSVQANAVKLGHFMRFLQGLDAESVGHAPHGGGVKLAFLQEMDTETLRESLLRIRGIGLETANALLLFAFERPIFLVTGGLYRLLNRHGLVAEDAAYEEIEDLLTSCLPVSAEFCARFYRNTAGVVGSFCSAKKPDCPGCPLGEYMEYAL